MATQLTDPVALRHLDPRGVDRNCARIPAARVENDWQVEIEGRWFRVVAEPQLIGDGEDEDGGRVQLLVAGPGVEVVDLVTFRRGERIWCKAPDPDALATLGCIFPDCDAVGPYTLTDLGLMCNGHVAAHALAETAGPDDDTEGDRG